MSKKTELMAEMLGLSRRTGSHLTQEAKDRTYRAFVESISKRYQVGTVAQVKIKHIHHFLRSMHSRNLSARTIQNAISHIRVALELSGRIQFVREQLSGHDLGLAQGSRVGTKYAIRADEYAQAVTLAKEKDGGVAVAIELCRTLGLRSAEAVRADQSLGEWARALQSENGRVIVSYGTKGGRVRDLPVGLIPDRIAALAAVHKALAISNKKNGRFVACETLKQSLDRFHNVCRSVGLVGENAPHSLRYAFACDAIEHLKRMGSSHKNSLAVTSQLLGHGDGRGRWVERVYSRKRAN